MTAIENIQRYIKIVNQLEYISIDSDSVFYPTRMHLSDDAVFYPSNKPQYVIQDDVILIVNGCGDGTVHTDPAPITVKCHTNQVFETLPVTKQLTPSEQPCTESKQVSACSGNGLSSEPLSIDCD